MTALNDWLTRIFAIRSGPEIEMGLERIRPIYERMNVAPTCPVILVAGTNGKGSVCAYIDAILRAAGFRVGRYTSPHIHRFNERVAINGIDATDDALVAAFDAVESARGDLPLTFFEYTTLAAFHCFSAAKLDAWVVEVGLGGRLDATNILDADCAVITSIGVDHTEFLGDTRELIAVEKAGILRKDRPAVIAEPDPPQSLIDTAAERGARAQYVGKDFGWQKSPETPQQWGFWAKNAAASASTAIFRRHGLPIPALRGGYQLGNAAAALAALYALNDRLPVSQGAVKAGLVSVDWPGRFQVLPGRPITVLDVGHNAHAALALERALADKAYFPVTHAVFAMLKDKDIRAVVQAVKGRIDRWHIATLPGPRGQDASALAAALIEAGVRDRDIRQYPSVADAFAAARKLAAEADRIVVFGSFLTVASVT
ncbi:MAG: bifunctional tetrahydrofolate synthase/dihydrofolate synthase [Casimicrobium sp.]